jgi:hypothetical protein
LTARITQSVGVPSTIHAPSLERRARRGWWSVRELLVALCSRSGATVVTDPSDDAARPRTPIPVARYPSSFVHRMFSVRLQPVA